MRHHQTDEPDRAGNRYGRPDGQGDTGHQPGLDPRHGDTQCARGVLTEAEGGQGAGATQHQDRAQQDCRCRDPDMVHGPVGEGSQ